MTVTLEEAQKRLPELIESLGAGESIAVESEGKVIAEVMRHAQTTVQPRVPGSAAHLPHWMAPDFDEPLDDFKEYME
jgi:antitoxin (DNA-binding transcriptional repressor) of toxin-antitoxin stability system